MFVPLHFIINLFIHLWDLRSANKHVTQSRLLSVSTTTTKKRPGSCEYTLDLFSYETNIAWWIMAINWRELSSNCHIFLNLEEWPEKMIGMYFFLSVYHIFNKICLKLDEIGVVAFWKPESVVFVPILSYGRSGVCHSVAGDEEMHLQIGYPVWDYPYITELKTIAMASRWQEFRSPVE